MSHEMDDPRSRLIQAFDELLHLYRLLEQENELLRGQLRRHTAGELQIRETERKMAELRGPANASVQDRLDALLICMDDEASYERAGPALCATSIAPKAPDEISVSTRPSTAETK